jgi:hypothetical protein
MRLQSVERPVQRPGRRMQPLPHSALQPFLRTQGLHCMHTSKMLLICCEKMENPSPEWAAILKFKDSIRKKTEK